MLRQPRPCWPSVSGKEGHSLGNGTVEKRYKHLAVLPAACADFEPDAVVIYCNSAQLLRLAMAAMWNRGAITFQVFSQVGSVVLKKSYV